MIWRKSKEENRYENHIHFGKSEKKGKHSQSSLLV
jgi:hypothetical protein